MTEAEEKREHERLPVSFCKGFKVVLCTDVFNYLLIWRGIFVYILKTHQQRSRPLLAKSRDSFSGPTCQAATLKSPQRAAFLRPSLPSRTIGRGSRRPADSCFSSCPKREMHEISCLIAQKPTKALMAESLLTKAMTSFSGESLPWANPPPLLFPFPVSDESLRVYVVAVRDRWQRAMAV
ncbi:uncharacterized protein VTP21DRAFT_8004 [Calcarisporiella thermophila]|uniref:uncharacterized protein n=1 Tax=Calcarisporiella thermophila TaxID=911321 RepID=UPI003742973F